MELSENCGLQMSYIKASGNDRVDEIKTIKECLKFYSERFKDRNAFVFAAASKNGTRVVVSWQELYEKSVIFAKSLLALGVKPGEIVLINMQPCPEWLFVAFGTIFAGAVIACVSFTYTDGSDLVCLMEKLKTCSALVFDAGVDKAKWNIVEKLIEGFDSYGNVRSSIMPSLRYLIGHKFPDRTLNIRTVNDLLNSTSFNLELPVLDPKSVVVLFQTSGSTGRPKSVAHTHASMLYIRQMMSETDSGLICFNERPFNWSGGFPLASFIGQTRVMISGYEEGVPNAVSRKVEVISEEKCLLTTAIPSVLMELVTKQDNLPDDWPLKAVYITGQPLSKIILKALGKVCKALISAYGSSELLLITRAVITDPSQFREYSSGTIVAGSGIELKIVGEDGDILPINTRGEIHVKSHCAFKEYYNDPEKTAEKLTDDGWFKTDDIGRITETGEVCIEGRKSNVIISNASSVAPEILENTIERCPGVKDIVIVPIPDEIEYQSLCACVTVQENCELTDKNIRQFCDRIHNDKPKLFTVLPKHYLFLDSLPRLDSGKFDRKDLERIAKRKFCAS